MKLRPTRITLALIILASAIPALAQVTDDDVRRARQELDRALAQSQALGDQVQEAWARQLALDHEINNLESSISHAQLQLAEAESRLEGVAIEMYISAASGLSLIMVVGTDSDSYFAGLEYLREVSGSDDSLINQLSVYRRELDHQTQRLREASSEQAALTADLQVMAADLLETVSAAQGLYDQLVERQRAEAEERRRQDEERRREEERRRLEAARTTTTATAVTVATTTPTTTQPSTTDSDDEPGDSTTTTTSPAPAVPAGGSCPVAGPSSFSDSWGAPRAGGRSHQGVDMIAARGTPIVAIFDGTIHRITTGALSGFAVWLRADNGDQFFYAHLDSYGDISVGQRVPQGYVVGYNGSTGNSPSWLPHLHFEFHPGGGAPVNPYPLVRSIC